QAAPREGLDPGRYGVEPLRDSLAHAQAGFVGPPTDPRRLAALHPRLTPTLPRYAAPPRSRQGEPRPLPGDSPPAPPPAKPDSIPATAIDRHGVRSTLESLPPRDPHYDALREALERYRTIAAHGGWKPIPGGRPLRRGQRGTRVAALRARLALTGDLGAARAQ